MMGFTMNPCNSRNEDVLARKLLAPSVTDFDSGYLIKKPSAKLYKVSFAEGFSMFSLEYLAS